jgi:hypothetical protein
MRHAETAGIEKVRDATARDPAATTGVEKIANELLLDSSDCSADAENDREAVVPADGRRPAARTHRYPHVSGSDREAVVPAERLELPT